MLAKLISSVQVMYSWNKCYFYISWCVYEDDHVLGKYAICYFSFVPEHIKVIWWLHDEYED